MNNEQIAEVLNWLKVRVDGTEQFVLHQSPLYAQEVVAWTFWENALSAIGCVLLSIIMLIISLISYRKLKSNPTEDEHFAYVIILIFSLIFGISAIGTTVPCIAKAVKAKVAPRVIIVEHIRAQTK